MDKRKDKTKYNKRGALQIRGFDEYVRNFLLKKIEKEHQNITKFCEKTDFERNDLRKFLKGERNWSFSKVLVLLHTLGYQTFGFSKAFITTKPKSFDEFQIMREGISLKEKKELHNQKQK